MKFVTISKARANLSELVRSVEAEDQVIVSQRRLPAMNVVQPDVPGQRSLGIVLGSFENPIDWAVPDKPGRVHNR